MAKKKKITAKEFDEKFDNGEDITPYLNEKPESELRPDQKLIAARNAHWDAEWARKPATPEERLEIAEKYIEQLEHKNHQLACHLATHTITHWHRIRDLPREERKPFREWLSGQTCPLITGVPYDQQDAYYLWDYRQWKAAWVRGKVAVITD